MCHEVKHTDSEMRLSGHFSRTRVEKHWYCRDVRIIWLPVALPNRAFIRYIVVCDRGRDSFCHSALVLKSDQRERERTNWRLHLPDLRVLTQVRATSCCVLYVVINGVGRLFFSPEVMLPVFGCMFLRPRA